ncbi:transferase [Thermoanaerobacterium thermosaccharolyticum]|uniref:Transferase n=1 Tax=Thermoanaerobacterium thermosaccharolyticum TaxID=1517 RepID=A0A223I1E5_THETR|nr:acetyltransferase [Thermoanaerobacterium thermosaccharolyticum]AST58542.1 transferase [Thermoanaerobacterium thermosaccharolyticum]
MLKDLFIIGAGGVGKEVALIVEEINNFNPTWNLIGFIDDNKDLHHKIINGFEVLGGVEFLSSIKGVIYVICAIANYKIKKEVVSKLISYNIEFANVIHPSVYLSKTNLIGRDVIIYPGCVLTTNIKIGDHVIISPKCGIGHESYIDDYTSLLWDVNIAGNVKINEGCLIGSNATIIQNKQIGKGTIIGAGAVVVDDIPPFCTAVGVPARPIKFHEEAK